jgi:replication fork protection complex subunit Tof1/Swi1
MVTLEIFYLVFRGIEKPDVLVRRGQDASKVIREEKLSKLLESELSRKRMDSRRGVTRHSRFGTTVVIEQGKDRFVMHKQASVANATLNPGALMDQAKKKKAVKVKDTNELAPPAELRPEAIEILQAVSMSFLESAFNRESRRYHSRA